MFGLCQILSFFNYLKATMSRDHFNFILKALAVAVAAIVAAVVGVLTLSGKVAPWTGRFYSLLDPR